MTKKFFTVFIICMNVSFGAKFISPAYIKESIDGTYKTRAASIAQLSTTESSDRSLLNNIVKNYINNKLPDEYIYADDISRKYNYIYRENPEDDSSKFFVLNIKDNNFQALDPENCLGVTQVNVVSPKYCELRYLQVNPNTKHGKEFQKYKGIGTAIIDFIKDFFNDRDIVVQPDTAVIDFYLKNKFKFLEECFMIYRQG